MSEQHTNAGGDDNDQTPMNPGFDREGPESTMDSTMEAPAKPKKQFAANLKHVFGSGPGKVAAVLVVVVVLVFGALGIRGLTADQQAEASAQADQPNAPRAKVSVAAVDEEEAARRAAVAASEAEVALKKGKAYQPDFIPAVTQSADKPSEQASQVGPAIVVPNFATRNTPPVVPASAPEVPPSTVAVQAGQGTANGGKGPQQAQANMNAQQAQAAQAAAQSEADKQAMKARDQMINEIRKGVVKDAEDVIRRDRSVATFVSYMPKGSSQGGNGQATSLYGNEQSATANAASRSSAAANTANRKPLLKAGNVLYATLDSEVNTDDGGDVFATVRGGVWDGCKLIGRIERAPRNINLRFNLLAPQDDRETITINALAIREEDARAGIADDIDYHTIERYSSLFVGSVLSGLSKAAQQPRGDTVVLPNGQVIVSQPEPGGKQIAMYALGEMGINASAEVRKNFSQPPTYKTAANKGFGLYIMADVFGPKK
jgi:intracellular multiplication protein IcmE